MSGHPSKGDTAEILGAILRELRKRGRTLVWDVGTIVTAPTTTTDILRVKAVPGKATAIYGYVISVEERCNIIMTVATNKGSKVMQIPLASDGTIILVIDGETALNEGWLAAGDIVFRPKSNATASKDYQVSVLIDRRPSQ